MTVQLGAQMGLQNLSMVELRFLWRRLDPALDWLSLPDHLYEVPSVGGTEPTFESLTAAALLCADTTSARIGVLMCYVGFRNPAYLAKTATTLDHISGGRFELGLGAGWAEEEAVAFGYDFPPLGTRMDMLEDALPLVKSMLTRPRTTYGGAFFAARDAANLPPPVRGHIPIWLGGTGERRTPRVAAAFADGWNVAFPSAELYSRLNAAVDRACGEIDRDPNTLERSVTLGFCLTTDPKRVSAIESNLRESVGDRADRVMDGLLLGTPDTAADRLMEYVDAGAQSVNIDIRAPIDHEAITAYVEEVVPAVRAAT